MKFFKFNERVMSHTKMAKVFKEQGIIVGTHGEYTRWINLQHGSKISEQLTIKSYDARPIGGCLCYVLVDNWGKWASDLTTLEEIKTFLKDNGFKTTHDWCVQDNGMSEETWQEWNKGYTE